MLESLAAIASLAAVLGTGVNLYVSSRLRSTALSAKLDLAQFENQLIARLNGTYVRGQALIDAERRCDIAHQTLGVALNDLRSYLERQDARMQKMHDEFVACRARSDAEHSI